jgi:chorismate mutase
MSRRQPKQAAPARKQPESTAGLRQALARCRKAELVEVLLELAQSDRRVLQRLTARLAVAATAGELVAATKQAIADAPRFDPRDINRNFAYDYEAYGEVKRNLGRLIDAGQLRLAMQLALELMKQGSHQVEMSDEGMMTEDIEDCLSVVCKALPKCDLPAEEVTAWSTAMRANDRVGFIATKQLESLSNG